MYVAAVRRMKSGEIILHMVKSCLRYQIVMLRGREREKDEIYIVTL